MSTVPLLYISDGTTTVDLMGLGNSGLQYKSWLTLSAPMSSSVWLNSGAGGGGGRVPGRPAYENTTEDIEVSANRHGTDNLFALIRTLQQLLIQAAEYWSTPGRSPVYLGARAVDETNTRYAVIKYGTIPTLGPLFGSPFIQMSSAKFIETIHVVVERGAWQDVVPESYSSIGITAWALFNDEMYGHLNYSASLAPVREEEYGTNMQEVWFSNSGINSNITVLMGYDASLASYTSNLAPWSASWETGIDPLQGEDIAVGDYFLFGITSALDHASGFNNLIISLITAAGSITFVKEFHDGTDWRALDEYGEINGIHLLRTTDPSNHLIFTPSDPVTYNVWDPATINGETAYFIRYRATSLGVSPVNPVFGPRPPYVPGWNQIRLPGSLVKGDIGTKPRLRIEPVGVTAWSLSQPQKVIGGIRSISRGSKFRSAIPISSRASDGGADPVVLTALAGTDTTIVDSTFSPYGDVARYSPSGTLWKESVRLQFKTISLIDIWSDYIGTYTAFVRFYKYGSTTQYDMRLIIHSHTQQDLVVRTVLDATGADAQNYGVAQFDNVVLPDIRLGGPSGWAVQFPEIQIWLRADNVTDDIDLYDIILIPTDEWSFSASSSLVVGGLTPPVGSTDYISGSYGISIDSTQIKQPFRAANYSIGGGVDIERSLWIADSWPSPVIPSGRDVFLCLFALQNENASGVDKVWASYPQEIFSISLAGAAEYMNVRGGG